MGDATHIIKQIQAGDTDAAQRLLPLVYDALHKLAKGRLANFPRESLQTTDLVHEAYLRLVGSDQDWDGRKHFFGAAAEAMRRLLVDRARRRKRLKHGGGRQRVQVRDSAVAAGTTPDEILIVDELFDRFSERHPREAQIAKLKYFAGFNYREISEALGVPASTVYKQWLFAKAWLLREFRSND